jgi:hypothetical protein
MELSHWIALAIGAVALFVAIVNTTGKDHLEKRLWLRRLSFAVACILIGLCIGWLVFRSNHDGHMQANRQPADEAKQTQPNNSKLAQAKDGRVQHGPAPEKEVATIQPEATATKSAAKPEMRHPTPEFIKATHEYAIPSARQEIAKMFTGIRVSWFGRLGTSRGSNSAGEKSFGIDRDTHGKSRGSFTARVDKVDFSSLKTMQAGDRVHVDGVIVTVWGDGSCDVGHAIITPIDRIGSDANK